MEENSARDQARAQFDSIKEMVDRLHHCLECDGFKCELTVEEIFGGLNVYYQPGDKLGPEDIDEYHDEEQARQNIWEDPLDVSVRSDWHSLGGDSGNAEYKILLCTGGPAVRIIGNLNEHQEPETARLEYQDWGTEWAEYPLDSEQEEILLRYARECYYF